MKWGDQIKKEMKKFKQTFAIIALFFNSFLPSSDFLLYPDNICKQIGPRSGWTEYQDWSGSKLIDTMIKNFEIYFLEKVWKITQHAELNE